MVGKFSSALSQQFSGQVRTVHRSDAKLDCCVDFRFWSVRVLDIRGLRLFGRCDQRVHGLNAVVDCRSECLDVVLRDYSSPPVRVDLEQVEDEQSGHMLGFFLSVFRLVRFLMSGILHRNRSRTAHQELKEPNHTQEKTWHVSDCWPSSFLKSTCYRRME